VVRRGRAGSARCSESNEGGLETSEMRVVEARFSTVASSTSEGPFCGWGRRWLAEGAAGSGWLLDGARIGSLTVEGGRGWLALGDGVDGGATGLGAGAAGGGSERFFGPTFLTRRENFS